MNTPFPTSSSPGGESSVPHTTRRPADLSAHRNADPVWDALQEEAARAIQAEPILAAAMDETVLGQPSLEAAVAARIAGKLEGHGLTGAQLLRLLETAYLSDPAVGDALRCDLIAIKDRDPAADTYLDPLMFYKGFHALSAHRAAHFLWKQGRHTLARLLQSMISEAFAVDIHPAARFGCGILLDHATSFVAGETAIVEDNVSILHEVTLGGTGKEHGNRHPIVRSGVLIGAGAKILGRVEIGQGSRIGAGSVVLADVPEHVTVVGVPAEVVGRASSSEPSECMDHCSMMQSSDFEWGTGI
ncbi:serine O-acetyltransferase [Sulfuriroseicoccus oceanibius]|uniref:Serine acetyltransferase n=1 Tax=Sulfuriroseicoccus oceanibius TaxID=2707525 RepID=A0A6B3LA20_9BACT|nr:serine O-acetyltransferase [Sulfuriroseicoccus oceanibius]QQL44545.1 serine O-acetyltransferase [Sulfuriroseicoccus oceanibius]